MGIQTDRSPRRLSSLVPLRLRVAGHVLLDPGNARRERRMLVRSRRVPPTVVAQSKTDRGSTRRSIDLSLRRSLVAVPLFDALPARHAATLLRRKLDWTMARTSAEPARAWRHAPRASGGSRRQRE